MKNQYKKLFGLSAIAVLVLTFCLWPYCVDAWHGLGYTSALRDALDGEIKYVEVQPNLEMDRYRLTDPVRIENLKAWLQNTNVNSFLRSASPLPVCKMRLVFRNGNAVELRHSAFIEGLNSDCRSDVIVAFRGYCGTGRTAELANILDPASMTPIRNDEHEK
jgi:hypothetical protein